MYGWSRTWFATYSLGNLGTTRDLETASGTPNAQTYLKQCKDHLLDQTRTSLLLNNCCLDIRQQHALLLILARAWVFSNPFPLGLRHPYLVGGISLSLPAVPLAFADLFSPTRAPPPPHALTSQTITSVSIFQQLSTAWQQAQHSRLCQHAKKNAREK